MTKRSDLVGNTYGEWTVLELSHINNRSRTIWKCQCSCGNIKNIPSSNLKSGGSKSCGHIVTHGMTGTPEYKAWKYMKKRCLNPNSDYYKRGIKIYPEWIDSFEKFYEYMGPQPPGTHLDRIKSHLDYWPGNVRWLENPKISSNKTTTKLNETAVRSIRILHKDFQLSRKEISLLFPEVSPITISDIYKYRRWKHVE